MYQKLFGKIYTHRFNHLKVCNSQIAVLSHILVKRYMAEVKKEDAAK